MNWSRKLFPAAVDIAISQLRKPNIIQNAYRFASFKPPTLPKILGNNRIPKILADRPISFTPLSSLPESLAGLQIKKRPNKKKTALDTDKGYFSVIAYATAEEYDLGRLRASIIKEGLYEFKHLPQANNEIGDISSTPEDGDFLYVTAKIQFGDEPREIFFFREGSVVLWNCTELECSNVLDHLRHFEVDSYDQRLVQEESDVMTYNYVADRAKLANGNFHLSQGEEQTLERYTFANALSTSVKLGIWEAALDRYVDSMAYVTEDLKRGRKINMSRAEVLRKTGELFALRHLINLSSDLLDTPDFYWDREELEKLYHSSCAFFSVQRRTKVNNP